MNMTDNDRTAWPDIVLVIAPYTGVIFLFGLYDMSHDYGFLPAAKDQRQASDLPSAHVEAVVKVVGEVGVELSPLH